MHWFIKPLNLDGSGQILQVLVFFFTEPALVPLTMGEQWGGYDTEMQRRVWVHWLGNSKKSVFHASPVETHPIVE